MLSAAKVNKPETIYFYTDQNELAGEWWERIKPLVTVEYVEPFTEMFGVPVPHPAHKSDIVRLQKLFERGGVYLDLSVICRNPFAPLYDQRVVMGQELVAGNLVGLCNAVVIAQPQENFIQRFLDGFDPKKSLWQGFRSRGPQDMYYSEISIKYSHFLSDYWPEEIHVVSVDSFFEPTYEEQKLVEFYELPDTGKWQTSYCHKIWSVARNRYIDGKILEAVSGANTAFGALLRRYL